MVWEGSRRDILSYSLSRLVRLQVNFGVEVVEKAGFRVLVILDSAGLTTRPALERLDTLCARGDHLARHGGLPPFSGAPGPIDYAAYR